MLLPGENGQGLFGSTINGTFGRIEGVLPASKAEVGMRNANLQNDIAQSAI